MHLCEGKKITVTAPEGGLVKDVPVLYGQLVIVPNYSIDEGETGTARYTGLFDGPIKEGDSPAFVGEYAYFDSTAKAFTKTVPSGLITDPVGVFIDDCVLLTGVLVAQS